MTDNTPVSVLTTKQREYLKSDESPDVSDAAERMMKKRIRERIRQAFADLALAYDNWDELGLDRVFEHETDGRLALENELVAAIALFYRGLFAQPIAFDEVFRRGVMAAEADRNDRAVSPRFELNPEGPRGHEMMQVADRVERLEGEEDARTIRIGELQLLAEAIAHSDVDIAEAIREGHNRIFDLDEDDEE